jgi:DNA-binding LacI/PurR family transcriptional regulator
MSTIRDVAERAGVAPSTVSLILNKKRSFSPKVESLVAKAIADLQYKHGKIGRPHKQPGSQSSTRIKKQIAFLMPQSQATLERTISYMKVLNGIETSCREMGLNLIVQTITPDHPLNPKTLANKIDGFIFLGEAGEQTFSQLLEHVPAVRVMGPRDEQAPWDQVTYNNAMIGQLAAAYLLARGHQCCAYFSPANEKNLTPKATTTFRQIPFSQINTERRDRFVQTINAAKGQVHINTESDPGQAVNPNLIKILDRLLNQKPRPTGLFVPADIITMRVQAAIQSLGITPGRDLQIVSANNDQTILQTMLPQPVSVDIHTQAIGATAVSMLLQRLTFPDHPRKNILLEPTLHETATNPVPESQSL